MIPFLNYQKSDDFDSGNLNYLNHKLSELTIFLFTGCLLETVSLTIKVTSLCDKGNFIKNI